MGNILSFFCMYFKTIGCLEDHHNCTRDHNNYKPTHDHCPQELHDMPREDIKNIVYIGGNSPLDQIKIEKLK